MWPQHLKTEYKNIEVIKCDDCDPINYHLIKSLIILLKWQNDMNNVFVLLLSFPLAMQSDKDVYNDAY